MGGNSLSLYNNWKSSSSIQTLMQPLNIVWRFRILFMPSPFPDLISFNSLKQCYRKRTPARPRRSGPGGCRWCRGRTCRSHRGWGAWWRHHLTAGIWTPVIGLYSESRPVIGGCQSYLGGVCAEVGPGAATRHLAHPETAPGHRVIGGAGGAL